MGLYAYTSYIHPINGEFISNPIVMNSGSCEKSVAKSHIHNGSKPGYFNGTIDPINGLQSYHR